MNLLFRVIFASACKSTHHKLALDALRYLRARQAPLWQNLFLKYYRHYLDGSKAPDTHFKDFRNHVLHVQDGYWGGARKTARHWYGRTVEALRSQDWSHAVYCAGVLSHYYTDPIQPFHTAQSTAENNIHRAAEWSIAKSYDEIREILIHQVGVPDLELPNGEDWLEAMVAQGADLSNEYYGVLIEHYNFARGRRRPPEGFDPYAKEVLARLIGHASVGFARILERTFEEAAVAPPRVDATVRGFLATLQIPIFWVTRKMADLQERQIVKAMYDELLRTGKVERTLPEDDRMVRDLHAKEIRPRQPIQSEIPSEPRTGGWGRTERAPSAHQGLAALDPSPPSHVEPCVNPTHNPTRCGADIPTERHPVLEPHATIETPAKASAHRAQQLQYKNPNPPDSSPVISPLRFYLETSDDVEEGPSVGPKTARRLAKIGIRTVLDLLNAEPDSTSARLSVRHISAQAIRDWQDQARLVCTVPNLRGHDAQILVACGWRTPEQIAAAQPRQMLSVVEPFAGSSEGQRIIRSGRKPDLAEISNWIAWAGQSRNLLAA